MSRIDEIKARCIELRKGGLSSDCLAVTASKLFAFVDVLVPQLFVHIAGQDAALAQYRKAAEEGLWVRLPCKVGDTVFDICDGTAYETKVLSFSVLGSRVACRTVSSHPNVEQFGTRIFLTRAEAEQALKGDAK